MALEIGEVVKIREDLIAGNHYHGVLFVEVMVCQDILKMFNTYFREKED